MVGSGLFTLLKVESDKIRAAPCEGWLRTLVAGIKPFVVRPGVFGNRNSHRRFP